MFWNGKTAIDGLSGSGKGACTGVGEALCGPTRYTRIGKRLEPGCDIDAVAKNVAILDDDVALMDADAKLDPLCFRNPGIAASNRPLHFARTAQRIDDARELDEKPVAGCLDQPPTMRRDRRVDHLSPEGPQPAESSFLVDTD